MFVVFSPPSLMEQHDFRAEGRRLGRTSVDEDSFQAYTCRDVRMKSSQCACLKERVKAKEWSSYVISNEPSRVKICTCLQFAFGWSARERRGGRRSNGAFERDAITCELMFVWERKSSEWVTLISSSLASFGIFGAERRRGGLRSDHERIAWKYFKGDVSYRKEEWCFSIGAQRYGSIKVALYSCYRAAWTNSRCSRAISLQRHERKHASKTAFLILPLVIYSLTRTWILPKRRIMTTWLLLISVEKILPPFSPPQQHNLFRGQAWFYNEIHKSLNNDLNQGDHVTVAIYPSVFFRKCWLRALVICWISGGLWPLIHPRSKNQGAVIIKTTVLCNFQLLPPTYTQDTHTQYLQM